MEQKFDILKQGVAPGIRKGWSGFLWMMEIILPVSFLVMLLSWSGWLRYLDFVIEPLMGLINLPPLAALPLLIGALTGIYGGIAAMVAIPLGRDAMTMIGIFLLMAHNLIQEGFIQGRSGINPWKATLFRIGSAAATLWLISPWFSPHASPPAAAAEAAGVLFSTAFRVWLESTAAFTVKAFFIITALLTMLEILKASGWTSRVISLLSPLLKLMGLERRLAFLWITAVIFGLTYGGSVIMEESKEGGISGKDLEKLHLSIGVNHSLIEDPLLFVALGLSAFWLYVPRLLMAVAVVQIMNLSSAVSRQRNDLS